MRALVLSPHTDDAELGVGGTMARMKREGWTVDVVIFASAPSEDWDVLAVDECRASLCMLGVANVSLWGYGNTHLPDHRQNILERLFQLRQRKEYDVVFLPCRADVNQDHATVTTEAIRAMRPFNLLGYCLPWNIVGEARLDFAIPLQADDVAFKERAVGHYKSQSHRPFMRVGAAHAVASANGVAWGYDYAEVFECIRYRWVKSSGASVEA